VLEVPGNRLLQEAIDSGFLYVGPFSCVSTDRQNLESICIFSSQLDGGKFLHIQSFKLILAYHRNTGLIWN